MKFWPFKTSKHPQDGRPRRGTRILSYLLVGGVTWLLFELISPRMDGVLPMLIRVFIAHPPSKAAGLLLSIISACVTFTYVAISQNRKRKGQITRYRYAEEKLMKRGRLSKADIITYHSQYNWDVYASISFSTLLIIVSLLFTVGTPNSRAPIDQLVIFLSLLFLSISCIMLAAVDLFHTNSLSPLITREKRFELIDVIIKIGSISVVLQICAVTIFLTLINSWLSMAISLLALWSVVYFSGHRGVPVDALTIEHHLTEEEVEEIWRA